MLVAEPAATTVRALLREAEARLAGLPSARTDAEWLLAALLRTGRAGLQVVEHPVPEAIVQRFRAHVDRRLSGEPLQYILGETEFCGHRLQVDPRVLIPRPETEFLVEQVVARLRQRAHPPTRILELGTGSGAIAIALAHQLSNCHILAAELSWGALQIASANVSAHQLTDRIELVQADWTDGLHGRFDAMVANPPYVPTDRLPGLPADVQWEPRLSLDGGPDGLAPHRRIVMDADRLLEPDGLLALECDEDRADALCREAQALPWVREARVMTDLTGRARAVFIEKRRAEFAS